MSTVYIKTPNLDITHEDQEQHGLKFNVQTQKDDIYYIKVTGEDTEIATWKTRVSGQDSSLDEINTIIASQPNPTNQQQEIIDKILVDNINMQTQIDTLITNSLS
jgi:uncharacterized coiled-coil protein SlyX